MLRDIAVFLIIYLVFRLIRNIFGSVKVVGNNPQQSQQGASYYRQEEGKVNISNMPGAKHAHPHHDTDGEYIDYKEV